MADVVKLKAGRSWSGGRYGITSLKRKYVIIRDAVTAADGEEYYFPGLPQIGSAHPRYPGLVVSGHEFEEGDGANKNTLTVTVSYGLRTFETSGGEEEDVANVTCQVEEWGWDAGTEERELIDAVDGKAVVNSAGDVFDRVPTVSVPAPTFTKAMKFRERQSGAMDCDCKVNASPVTIGERTYPTGSLLCSVSERRIFSDASWAYRYVIQLKFRTNPVKLAGEESATDIGWDVAITDAGMRELDEEGKLKLIKAVDAETGKKCTVTSPELLNGAGKAVTRTDGESPKPYNMLFQAYERTDIPSWFYSEPPVPEFETEIEDETEGGA